MKKSELFRKVLSSTLEAYINTHHNFTESVIEPEFRDEIADAGNPETYYAIKVAADHYLPYIMECVAAGVTNVLAETMCDDNDLDLTSYEAIRGISDEVWKEIES